jgi:dTDP-4-dehydrorhamnose reductase
MERGMGNLAVWGGIECTINRVGDQYFDQLEQAGHYDREDDIHRFADLGITTLRYPILWEKHQPQKDLQIDWLATGQRLGKIRSLGIEIIAGLVHHGSGPSYANMLDDNFVEGLTAYAAIVAEQFPWIKYYTPVNEPLTTARFCGLYGLWHPHSKSADAFCRILVNECKATVLAMQAIRKINPGAMLVQTDDLGKTHSTGLLKYQADFENDRRWLSFDLLCGRVDQAHPLWDYLLSSGLTIRELEFFIENKCPPDIIGINHYLTSERYLDQNLKVYPKHTRGGNGKHRYADVEAVRVRGVHPDGPYRLIKEAWDRYHLPIVITETHLHCTREEQMRWLKFTWDCAQKLRSEGVNIKAITAWALLGSFGWNNLLTKQPGTYEAGVFDLSGGEPRATALAQMITAYNTAGTYKHPVLSINGWWLRKCRSIYGRRTFSREEICAGESEPVLILGNLNCPLFEQYCCQCSQRAIRHVRYDHTDRFDPDVLDALIQTLSPWAIIDSAGSLTGNTEIDIRCRINKRRLREILPELCRKYDAKLLTVSQIAHADLSVFVDATLNLVLDDEKGIWEVSEQGLAVQIGPDSLNHRLGSIAELFTTNIPPERKDAMMTQMIQNYKPYDVAG